MNDAFEDKRLYTPAYERNRGPILAVLRRILPDAGRVLEVASGSGQHGVYFSPHFPGLAWQTSDPDPRSRESIAAWIAAEAPHMPPPVDLDVLAPAWPVGDAGAMIAINMIHISPWAACQGLLAGAGRILGSGGVLYLYGPYKQNGRHTAPSNAAFDDNLRRRNPEWGVRDLGDVVDEAAACGLSLGLTEDMPANNLSVVFRRD